MTYITRHRRMMARALAVVMLTAVVVPLASIGASACEFALNCGVDDGDTKPNPNPNPDPDPDPKENPSNPSNPGDPGDDTRNEDSTWVKINQTVTADFRDKTSTIYEKEVKPKCSNSVGARIRYSYWYNQPAEASKDQKLEGWTCLKLKITNSTKACLIQVDATIWKRVPDERTIRSATGKTAWGKLSAAKRKTTECNTSASASAQVSADAKEYGRYESQATKTLATQTVRETQDPIKGKTTRKVTGVSAAYKKVTPPARGQLTCNGWTNSWSGNPSWSHDDCLPNTKWRCVAPSGDKLTIDGKSLKSTSLFRDGSAHKIVWGRFKPSSEFRITDKKAQQTRFGRSGTPWKDNGQTKNTDALVSLKNGSTSLLADKWGGWKNGLITKADLRGFWASDKDTPTVITPRWKYKGELTVKAVIIESVTSEGKIITRTINRKIKSTGTCDGTPLTASFVRGTTTG